MKFKKCPSIPGFEADWTSWKLEVGRKDLLFKLDLVAEKP